MADLNNTIVHGKLRVTHTINANNILKKDKPVLSQDDLINNNQISDLSKETNVSGKTYAVKYDNQGKLAVNVPWAEDTDSDKKTSSSQNNNKLYIVGAETQSSEGVETFTNQNIYINNNNIYIKSNDPKVPDKKLIGIEDLTYTNPHPCTESVGGIEKGTTFDHVPIIKIIEKMLYKLYKPTVSSFKINKTVTNNYYGGKVVVNSISGTLNPGSYSSAEITTLSVDYDNTTYNVENPSLSFTIPINQEYIATKENKDIKKSAILHYDFAGVDEEITSAYAEVHEIFNQSSMYYGATTSQTDINGLQEVTNQTSWGSSSRELSTTCNKNKFTIFCPNAWGNTIVVTDGAKNPVEGVFELVKSDLVLTNKNGYQETYNVFQSNVTATGRLTYFIKISN